MKKILIVTGGSGGHVMPALSIFDHLKKNFQLTLVTDLRGSKYINKNNYNFNIINVPNLFENVSTLTPGGTCEPFNSVVNCWRKTSLFLV